MHLLATMFQVTLTEVLLVQKSIFEKDEMIGKLKKYAMRSKMELQDLKTKVKHIDIFYANSNFTCLLYIKVQCNTMLSFFICFMLFLFFLTF